MTTEWERLKNYNNYKAVAETSGSCSQRHSTQLSHFGASRLAVALLGLMYLKGEKKMENRKRTSNEKNVTKCQTQNIWYEEDMWQVEIY